MPRGQLPATHLDLLERPVLGHLATVDSNNRPQVNPVWLLFDGKRLLLSVKPETAKFRNMRTNHSIALSILDPGDDFRYLELRGRVISFELYKTLTFVNLLAQKYTGADFTAGSAGEERYKVTIDIESWTASGG
jgi:PPOX class probable F420-dependent enzyme